MIPKRIPLDLTTLMEQLKLFTNQQKGKNIGMHKKEYYNK